MMMLSEIAKALNSTMSGADVNVLSVGSDSRNITKGQLFVGIKGEHFDGSAYAAEAIKKGAAAALVSDAGTQASPSVLVDDTRLALGELAHYWREKFTMPLVAVTGSNGKTTVKEMIAAILTAANGCVLATEGNLNNDIGLPLSLLKVRAKHTYAVIELGMNHEGEIRYLTQIAKPQVALINNAGTAHIGELGSREAIARAKGEIFEGLNNDGVAIINLGDDFAGYWQTLNKNKRTITFGLNVDADISAQYETQSNHFNITLKTPEGEVVFTLNMLGEHNVSNALAASAVAVALGISNADIAQGLGQFDGVKGRLNQLQGLSQSIVIDDTYNANPDSMKVAIDALVSQSKPEEMFIFVMGDMGELGESAEKMHAEIGEYAKRKGISHFFSFGELSQLASAQFGRNGRHFDDMEKLVEAVKAYMELHVTVLVKGSRFMKMERVVNRITEEKSLEGVH